MPASRKVEHPERIKNRLKQIIVSLAPKAKPEQQIAILYDISQCLGMKKPYERRIYANLVGEVFESAKRLVPELCSELIAEIEQETGSPPHRKIWNRRLVAGRSSKAA
jgi:hypothetical protein